MREREASGILQLLTSAIEWVGVVFTETEYATRTRLGAERIKSSISGMTVLRGL